MVRFSPETARRHRRRRFMFLCRRPNARAGRVRSGTQDAHDMKGLVTAIDHRTGLLKVSAGPSSCSVISRRRHRSKSRGEPPHLSPGFQGLHPGNAESAERPQPPGPFDLDQEPHKKSRVSPAFLCAADAQPTYSATASSTSLAACSTTGRSTSSTIAIGALSPARNPHFRIRR